MPHAKIHWVMSWGANTEVPEAEYLRREIELELQGCLKISQEPTKKAETVWWVHSPAPCSMRSLPWQLNWHAMCFLLVAYL